MRVTIGGMPGAGKGTVAKYLAKSLKLKYYGIGDIRRKMALDRGISINELNRIGEKESWTDREVDEYQKKMRGKDNFIMEGRLSWHFVPNSIKLFLKVRPEIGAKRILKAKRKSEEYGSLKEAIKKLEGRMKSDVMRYKKTYGINNLYALDNYDIVMDTSGMSMREMNKRAKEAVVRYKG